MKRITSGMFLALFLIVTGCINSQEIEQNASTAGVQSQTEEGLIKLAPLPYELNALEPYISAETMSYHYGKHHRGYINNLNKLIAGTKWEKEQSLENIVRESYANEETAIFNNAAQGLNHEIFWKSMKPNGGGEPSGELLEKIDESFGSLENFRAEFISAAVSQFGSGWVWLVQEENELKIIKSSNADTPAALGLTHLITCDVWEHAYYIDYRNERKRFVEVFLDNLVNWDYAATQLKQ